MIVASFGIGLKEHPDRAVEVSIHLDARCLANKTKLLPADAGRIFDVPFEVLKYDVLSDGTICG